MAAFNWISSVSADKSGSNNGKNETLRCGEETRPPPPPFKVTVVWFGLRTAALVTHQRPLSLFPSPPKSERKTLIK